MTESSNKGYAFNRTRQTFLASELDVANTHWSRLRGLMLTHQERLASGRGLWIVPCQGVHTMAMRYPIDVVYLDADNVVIHVEENVKPWRFTPIRLDTETVLEIPSRTVWSTETQPGDQIEIAWGNSHGRNQKAE